jgi:hypothetical protein
MDTIFRSEFTGAANGEHDGALRRLNVTETSFLPGPGSSLKVLLGNGRCTAMSLRLVRPVVYWAIKRGGLSFGWTCWHAPLENLKTRIGAPGAWGSCQRRGYRVFYAENTLWRCLTKAVSCAISFHWKEEKHSWSPLPKFECRDLCRSLRQLLIITTVASRS